MNNTIKRTWNQGSMVNIEDLRGMTFQAESGAHTFVISAVDANNNPITLSGTPSGTMLRPDNTDQALTCSVSDGKVYATLPAGCYDVPGRAGITIFLTSGGQKVAIYAAVVSVTRTQSGTASPGTTASVVDLVNAIAAAVATIPASYTDLMASVAPTYSSSGLYAAGSYAWYNGKLYRCTTAITTAETWTAAHWTLANLGSDLVDLKSEFTSVKKIDDTLVGPQRDLYAYAYVPLVFEKGRSFGNSGFNPNTKAATSQLLPPGVYMFPSIASGFSYSVYRYINDSSGSSLLGSTTGAFALQCDYNFIVNVISTNDITNDDVVSIVSAFVPMVEKPAKSLYEKTIDRIIDIELDLDQSVAYPALFDSGRYITNGFSKPRNGSIVSRIKYPAGKYNISISNNNYEFSVFYYNTDASGEQVYGYESTALSNVTLTKPFYINLRKSDTTNITPDEKRSMCAALSVERTGNNDIIFCEDVSKDVLVEFYVPPTSPIYNTQWKIYRVAAEAEDYRIGIYLADSTLFLNGFDVAPEYYSDKIHVLTYGGNALAYYILHYTGTDYYRTITAGAAYTSAVNDINNSPRIKEYLSRTENLVLMGDSIFGYGYVNELEPILASESKKQVFNCGFGGCTMAWRSQDGSYTFDPLSFASLADSIASGDYSDVVATIGQDIGYPARCASLKEIDWTKPTTVIVDYVNNDMAVSIPTSIPIGDIWQDGDTESDWDKTTLLGAMNYGIHKILSVYPHVRFIFCTPIWRYINNTMFWDFVNAIGKSSSDYRAGIMDNTKQLGISCFDLSTKSGRNPWNTDEFQLDDSHWNVKGYQKFARQLNAIDEGSLN